MTTKCYLFAERETWTAVCLLVPLWKRNVDSKTSVNSSLTVRTLLFYWNNLKVWIDPLLLRAKCHPFAKGQGQQSVDSFFTERENLTAKCHPFTKRQWKLDSKTFSERKFDGKMSPLHWQGLTAKCEPFTRQYNLTAEFQSTHAERDFDSKVWTLHREGKNKLESVSQPLLKEIFFPAKCEPSLRGEKKRKQTCKCQSTFDRKRFLQQSVNLSLRGRKKKKKQKWKCLSTRDWKRFLQQSVNPSLRKKNRQTNKLESVNQPFTEREIWQCVNFTLGESWTRKCLPWFVAALTEIVICSNFPNGKWK